VNLIEILGQMDFGRAVLVIGLFSFGLIPLIFGLFVLSLSTLGFPPARRFWEESQSPDEYKALVIAAKETRNAIQNYQEAANAIGRMSPGSLERHQARSNLESLKIPVNHNCFELARLLIHVMEKEGKL